MSNELDCRGQACPKPVMMTRELLESASPETVDILVDNQAAVENVSRFLNRSGYEVSVEQNRPEEWRLSGKKSGDRQKEAQASTSSKTLVLITTESLGRGDDGLGHRLMTTFLETLPELGEQLWRIVLLNGGVRLAAGSGPSVPALQKLAASGVDILVCGTCLMYYQLEKQVGETTNMMDVVTSMALADKIIRP